MKKVLLIFIISTSLISACSISEQENTYGGFDFTTLDKLIKQLDNNWELEETGKAYWIGYTDLMYKIAEKKDTAIDRLVKYINSTKSDHGKQGAVFCIHLIGIDSKVVGRFKEEFKNKKAREALLKLIKQKELSSLIIFLLARDPWPSDLPVLVNSLENNPSNVLANALFRYSRNKMPFRDSISEYIDTIKVNLEDALGVHYIGKIVTVYREMENEPQIQITDKENSFKNGDILNLGGNDSYTNKANQLNHQGNVLIQSGSKVRVVRKFISNKLGTRILHQHFKCSPDQIIKSKCEEMNNLFYDLFKLSNEKVSSFSDFSDTYFHYFSPPNILTVCDSEEACKRWLEFFKKKGY